MSKLALSALTFIAFAFSGQISDAQGLQSVKQDTSLTNHPAAVAKVSLQPSADAGNDKEYPDPKKDVPPDTKSLFTFSITDLAIAVFALCSVIVGAFQWRAMKASVTSASISAAQQSRDTQAAIAEAKKSAEAATLAANVAKDALHISLRPNLSAAEWTVSDFKIGSNPKFRFSLVNFGPTNAYVIARTGFSYHIGAELPFPRPPYEPGRDWPEFAVRPHEPFPDLFQLPETLTEDLLDRLTNRGAFLFVWAKATYRDIFGNVYDLGFVSRWQPIPVETGLVTIPIAPSFGYSEKQGGVDST